MITAKIETEQLKQRVDAHQNSGYRNDQILNAVRQSCRGKRRFAHQLNEFPAFDDEENSENTDRYINNTIKNRKNNFRRKAFNHIHREMNTLAETDRDSDETEPGEAQKSNFFRPEENEIEDLARHYLHKHDNNHGNEQSDGAAFDYFVNPDKQAL
jgi:hypothetical protein